MMMKGLKPPSLCTLVCLLFFLLFTLLVRWELLQKISEKKEKVIVVQPISKAQITPGSLSTLIGNSRALLDVTLQPDACKAQVRARMSSIVMPIAESLHCPSATELPTELKRGRREEIVPSVRCEYCREKKGTGAAATVPDPSSQLDPALGLPQAQVQSASDSDPSSRPSPPPTLRPRRAVIIPFRTSNFTYHLRQLICTFRKHVARPEDYELRLLATREDYKDPEALARAQSIAPLYFVEELRYQNNLIARWQYNWLKLRVFGMEEFDSILVMDSDMVIASPTAIEDVFRTLEQSKGVRFVQVLNVDTTGCFDSMGRTQGGMFAIKPCKEVEEHMIALLDSCPPLRFTQKTAEQDFLDWYFHFERISMPLEYNYVSHLVDVRGLTYGGLHPKIVHWTREKLVEDDKIQNASSLRAARYLCSEEELERLGKWEVSGKGEEART